MSKYSSRRVLFISSADQLSGASDRFQYDFYIDLESSVSQLHPLFHFRDPDVRIYASIAQAWVPVPTLSKGVIDRDPFVYEGSSVNGTRRVPQVQMLRVHTNLLHDNSTSAGYSTTALQFPFMTHYHEADLNNPFSHAFVSYEEPHPEHAGCFELINGLDALGMVRFWVTDEQNRMIRTKPQVPIHLALTLRAETTMRKRKHSEEAQRFMRESVGLQRLMILQNDNNLQAARRGLLTMQQLYDRDNERDEILEDNEQRRQVRRLGDDDEEEEEAGQEEAGPGGLAAAGGADRELPFGQEGEQQQEARLREEE